MKLINCMALCFCIVAFSNSIIKAEKKYHVGEIVPESSKIKKIKIVPLKILGWSKTGMLAYTEPYNNSWKPESGTRYVIFNAVKDKIVMEKKIADYDKYLEDLSKTEYEVIKKRILKKFNAKMKALKIVNKKTMLDYFPIKRGHAAYNMKLKGDIKCEIKAKENNTEDSYCTRHYDLDYKVIIKGKNIEKTIKKGKESLIIYKQVVGFYESPFEKRIAVLVKSYYAGLECEHFVKYDLYGCNMFRGFEY